MATWTTQHWYVIFGVCGTVAYIGFRMSRRPEDETFGKRLLHTLVPLLDPTSEERQSLTPRAFLLFGAGLFILLLAAIFVPGFVR